MTEIKSRRFIAHVPKSKPGGPPPMAGHITVEVSEHFPIAAAAAALRDLAETLEREAEG